MRICVIVYCAFLPQLRYGRPYVYSLAMNQLGHEIVVLSVSSSSRPTETQMDFGKVVTIKDSPIARLFGIDEPFRVLLNALKIPADIYYIFAPTPIFVATFLKLLGKHVIYDIGDDHPSLFVETLVRKLPKTIMFKQVLQNCLRAVEGNACKVFDYNITLTDTLRNDRLCFSRKIKAINYCTHPVYNQLNVESSLVEEFKGFNVLVYVGEISHDKGLDTMLETTNLLSKKGVPVKLLLIGDFCQPHTSEFDKKYFYDYIKNNHLEKAVKITGWVPYKEVPKYINLGKIGFVLIKPWCYSYKISIPDKAIDILSCGLPIIATKEMSEVKHLIEKSKAGIIVDSADSNEIAEVLFCLFSDQKSLDELRRNALSFSKNYHTIEKLSQSLSNVIDNIPKS
jgi:glycosyltransferase involved in cell wall biosynthesis